MKEVTDPALLAQLNAPEPMSGKEVTDPAILAQLNGPEATPKHDGALMTLVKNPLDALNAPFQVVGEAIRQPLEGDSNFRAPTILQKMGLAQKSDQPPGDPFHIANAVIRSGAELARTGSTDAAKAEYHRDAGIPGAIQDTVLALASGKVAPEVVNAPVEAVGKAVGEGADLLKSGATKVGQMAIRSALGPSAEAQAARFADPNLANAPREGQIADKLAETANHLSQKISDADNEAWKTLRTDYLPPYEGGTAIPKQDVLDLISNAKNELSVHGGGTVGKAAKAAAATLDGIAGDVENVGKFVGGYIKSQQGANSSIRLNNFLPEATVKGIVQSLDQNIDWGNPELGPVNRALEGARMALDTTLKGQNQDYAKAMEPVSQMVGDLNGLKRKLGLTKDVGEGFQAGNTTPDTIKRIARKELPETDRILQGVQDATGQDVKGEAQTARLAAEFDPGVDRSRGSKRTIGGGMVGTALGWLTGHPVLGNLTGTAAGALADNYGAAAAGSIIDKLAQGNSAIARLLAAAKSNTNPAAASALQQLIQNAGTYGPGLRYADQRRRR